LFEPHDHVTCADFRLMNAVAVGQMV
jgi:hypothetical protein